MREADVTLTDFGLAALAFGFAAVLLGDSQIATLFAGLFASLGLAALLGALSHGWFWDRNQGSGQAIWLATMLAIGLANTCLWLIAAKLFGLSSWSLWAACGLFALYAALAVFVTRDFILASGFSLPPTLALIAAFVATGNWLGAAGLGVALAAAAMQMAQVTALGLTYNAFYHVVQAVAFVLVFLAVP